jgi:hypothetical protein
MGNELDNDIFAIKEVNRARRTTSMQKGERKI